MTQAAEFTGKTVGGAAVLGRAEDAGGTGSKRALWVCICQCGAQCIKPTQKLQRAENTGRQVFCGVKCEALRRRASENGKRGALEAHKRALEPRHMIEVAGQACFWCGRLPSKQYPSRITRLHPAAGWTMANTIGACRHCDRLRGTAEKGPFLEWVRAIVARHGARG